MPDFKISCTQGSDYVIETDNAEYAIEEFDIIRQRRGLDGLKGFGVIGVELVEDTRPTHYIGEVKIL